MFSKTILACIGLTFVLGGVAIIPLHWMAIPLVMIGGLVIMSAAA
jgi:hypothetical protein